VRQRIDRVELYDFSEYFDGLGLAARALQARRHFVERAERVARQAELVVKLREFWDDVRVLFLELREVLGDDFADLFVDRDRFQRVALARVEPADSFVGRDRAGVILHFRLEVANLQEGPSVVRIFLDDLLILDDRLVVLLLLDVLLGGDESLLTVDRHESGYSSVQVLERGKSTA